MKLIVIVFIFYLTNADALRTVCFFSNWAHRRNGKAGFLPQHINPDLCTHIIYGYAAPVGLDIGPTQGDEETVEMYGQMMRIKQINADVKILLSLGGKQVRSEYLMPLVESTLSMSIFAKNALLFLRKWRFDGLDIDWDLHLPGGNLSDIDFKSEPYVIRSKFQRLMEVIMNYFKEESVKTGDKRLMLTVSMPVDKSAIELGYSISNLSKTVDFMSIMSFDMYGPMDRGVGFNSPLYANPKETGANKQLNLDWIANYYVSLGAPKSILNIGIATYGKTFTLKDPSNHSVQAPAIRNGNHGIYTEERGILAYFEVCSLLPKGRVMKDPDQKSSYVVVGDQWVGYDDIDSVIEKACYVRKNGYGGVFMWTIDYDDFTGSFCNQGPYPLLKAAHDVMQLSPEDVSCESIPSYPDANTGTDIASPYTASYLDAFRTVCYCTSWGQHRSEKGYFIPEYIDPSLCSYIIYAYAKPENLGLVPDEENDSSNPLEMNVYEQLIKLKVNNPNVRILLSVGGTTVGSGPFIPIVQSTDSMSTFAKNAVTYLRKNKFDGLDMAWKNPGSTQLPGIKDTFLTLMQEIMNEFDDEGTRTNTPRLLLTLAADPLKANIDESYLVANLSSTVDFISIMTFDFRSVWDNVAGFNSPLYAHPDERGEATQLNVDWVAKYYVSLGAPKKVINIGIATYGRSYTLKDPKVHFVLSSVTARGYAGRYTREPGVMAYYEVCDMKDEKARIVRVNSQMNPYIVRDNQWVGYDDVVSVEAKAHYVITNGYGGVTIWSLDYDDFLGTSCNHGKFPLLTTAFHVMNEASEAKRQADLANENNNHTVVETAKSSSPGLNLVGNRKNLYIFYLLFFLFNTYTLQG